MELDVTILLVEDNDDDVVLIREAFEQQSSFSIAQVAMDGKEALAILNRQGKYVDAALPRLILLDINMPRMNGFELLQAVKSDPGLKHIPIIMLTTSGREEDVERSYANGAASYIRKPSSMQAMVGIVEQFAVYWTDVSKVPYKNEG